MQRQLTNVQKSIMHVQSCCFANLNPLLSCHTLCRHRHHCLSTLLAPISKARDCRYNKTPFNTDTEGGTESVLLNGVSVNRESSHFESLLIPKICDPILVTLLKMQPHYSHSSRETATPSSGTSLLAPCKGVPPPPTPRGFDYCKKLYFFKFYFPLFQTHYNKSSYPKEEVKYI